MPVLSESNAREGFVQKLDVRTKMFITVIASIAVVFYASFEALFFLTGITFLYVLSIGRLKVLGICYVFILLMWGMAMGCIYLIHLSFPMMPMAKASSVLIPFLRTAIMMNTVIALALSSNIQNLLIALKGLRLPFWLYIPAAVVVRFVPTFIKDIQQIHETMKTRGYNLNPLFFLRHPILTVRLVLAPILFRALRSSDDLSIAAELKGMNPDVKMQSYKPQAFARNDYLILGLTVAAIMIAAAIQMYVGVPSSGGRPV